MQRLRDGNEIDRSVWQARCLGGRHPIAHAGMRSGMANLLAAGVARLDEIEELRKSGGSLAVASATIPGPVSGRGKVGKEFEQRGGVGRTGHGVTPGRVGEFIDECRLNRRGRLPWLVIIDHVELSLFSPVANAFK